MNQKPQFVTSIMNQAVVLFSCLALVPFVNSQAPVFCLSGVIPCAANAACAGGSPAGDCVCNAGFSGDGRVQCEATSTRCVCSVRADPIVTTPDSPSFKLNLPCSLFLVQTISIANYACFIGSVIAHPDVRPSGPSRPPFPTFTKSLELSTFLPTAIAGTLDSTGFSAPSAAVTTVNVGGFQTTTITAPACSGFQLGFNSTYGAAFVEFAKSPVSNILVPGLCGNCDGSPENIGSTAGSQLAYSLQYLAPAANQIGPFNASCGALQTTMLSCSNRTATAACASILGALGTCLKSKGQTDTQVMTAFSTCVGLACTSGAVAACGYVTSVAGSVVLGCPVPTSCP